MSCWKVWLMLTHLYPLTYHGLLFIELLSPLKKAWMINSNCGRWQGREYFTLLVTPYLPDQTGLFRPVLGAAAPAVCYWSESHYTYTYPLTMDDGGEEPERAEMSAPNTWMECSIYQNYTASEVMVQGLAGVVSQVSPNAQSQRSIPMLSPTDLSQSPVPQSDSSRL